MAKGLEKYGEVIGMMITDAETVVNDAKAELAAKQKECRGLESQLKELEKQKEEWRAKLVGVAKDYILLLLKSFFKKAALKELPRVINPVKEYIQHSDWVDETKAQLENARNEAFRAQMAVESAQEVLTNIKSIKG